MSKFLDGTGITDLLNKIKNAFVSKDDVDSTPTANSSNLVTSGGVYSALQNAGTVQDVTVGGESVVSGGIAAIPAILNTIDTVSVSVDDNTGTPSATGSVSGSTLSLSFSNLKGANGSTGTGISSVVQTTESTASGGTNVITVTKTDGTTSTFNVRNGDAVGSVTVVQTTGDSTTSAMSQDAVTRELARSKKEILRVSPNSVFDRLNKNPFIYSGRTFSFSDIRNATVVYRCVLYENQTSVNHYSMGNVLGFFQSSNTYLTAKINNYTIQVLQYVNGTKVHEENVVAINTGTGINTYGDFAVMFDKEDMKFRFFGYDTSNSTIVKRTEFSISGWDLSSLTDVYFGTSLSEYGTCLCCSNVLVNSPSMLSSYIAAPLNIGYYNTPQGTVYNKNIYLAGTGVTVGGTIVQTISDTDKIVSVSNSSLSYFALGPSNLDDSYEWYHVRLDFTSVGTGAYLQCGVQYKYIYIESEGLLDTSIISGSEKFYPVVGKTYDLYYCFGPGQTQTYQCSYGIRVYGDMTIEVSEPYMFNNQIQNICAETFNGEVFTGAIPFEGKPTFIDYYCTSNSTPSLRIPLYSIKVTSGSLYMWTGSVWKQINNT